MIPIPLWDAGKPIRFLGQSMMQNRLAPLLWSYLFEMAHPARIIEIGTHDGGFTAVLGFAAISYGAQVISFDLNDRKASQNDLLRHLGVDVRRGDCFSCEGEIGDLILGGGRSYLLCDGGNKPKELETFAKYLKPGDIIAAHDYEAGPDYWCCQEVSDADVAPVMRDNQLVPIYPEFARQCAWFVAQRI